MLIYTGTKAGFKNDLDDDVLIDKLKDTIRRRLGRGTGASEIRSWDNSLRQMYQVLNDEIPDDCGVAIEYNVPLTNRRVDFIISGYGDDGVEHADIIELKQWDSVEAVHGMEAVVRTFTGGAIREAPHPSYQAWSYTELIADYNTAVQDREIVLHPCAYLHNYEIDGTAAIADPIYQPYIDLAPMFGKHERKDLRSFITADLKRGDQGAIIEHIEHGKLRPSKSLQDALAGMMQGNREFTLIDSQKVFYEKALLLERTAREEQHKIVYIVEGGPGSGKSVIAVNLLAQMTLNGQVASYISKNSAPRNVYSTLLKQTQRKGKIDALFRGSGSFTETDSNVYDALIVDEAHRLNEKSGMFQNKGENQIKEVINTARFSVFFIDENQRVTTKDIGSVDEILKWAEVFGAEVVQDELDSQFRCNGSDGYLSWLDNTLEIRHTANWSLDEIDYDIEVFDDVVAMEQAIREKNSSHNKARLVAGYCWNWIKDGKNDSEVHDIQIGDWSISWNLGSTATYAIDEGSIDECGCIHTVQGLEFDYVGVIIGPDMRFEGGHVITDYTKRAKTDQALKGVKGIAKKNPAEAEAIADPIIRNTYRTLMTRGMKGCYVYCCDPALAEHLRESIRLYDVEHSSGEITRMERVD